MDDFVDPETIAKVIRRGRERCRDIETFDAITQTAYAAADHFGSENPHFDRSAFIKACGIEETGK